LELPHTSLKSDTAFAGLVQPFAKRPLPSALYHHLSRMTGGGQGKAKNLKGLLTRFVILRDFETIAPSLQMTLVKKVEEVESLGLRFVLVARDAELVVAQLRANLLVLRLGQLPMDLWLRRLLAVAVAQRVGYEREGLELIAGLVGSVDLGAAVDLLQQTFVHTGYVSKANVVKTVNAIFAQFPDSAVPSTPPVANAGGCGSSAICGSPPRRALPRDMVTHKPTQLQETFVLGRGLRCGICTLPPPCQHLNGSNLLQTARQRIKQMHQDPEMAVCQSYARTGACEAMNHQGYCRMHHPRHLFDFVPPTRRCPTCTIPEPCRNCPWFKLRRAIANAASAATIELADLKYRGERSTVTLARYAL
jgi:hypothetical protein